MLVSLSDVIGCMFRVIPHWVLLVTDTKLHVWFQGWFIISHNWNNFLNHAIIRPNKLGGGDGLEGWLGEGGELGPGSGTGGKVVVVVVVVVTVGAGGAGGNVVVVVGGGAVGGLGL
jgi:hypothetical protein